MCCVQTERVFPASDSEEADEGGGHGPLGSGGSSGGGRHRSCPPPRELPLESQWAAEAASRHYHHSGYYQNRSGGEDSSGTGRRHRCAAYPGSLFPARRSFSSSLVAELRAAGPGPTLHHAELMVT